MPRGDRQMQAGFSYVLLLAVLAIVAMTTTATVAVGARITCHAEAQAIREAKEDIKAAIESYRLATPVGQAVAGPTSVTDLLADRRAGSVRRHLRRFEQFEAACHRMRCRSASEAADLTEVERCPGDLLPPGRTNQK